MTLTHTRGVSLLEAVIRRPQAFPLASASRVLALLDLDLSTSCAKLGSCLARCPMLSLRLQVAFFFAVQGGLSSPVDSGPKTEFSGKENLFLIEFLRYVGYHS